MSREIIIIARDDDADDLLLELSDDPRVSAVTMRLGEGKYRVAVPAAPSPADQDVRAGRDPAQGVNASCPDFPLPADQGEE